MAVRKPYTKEEIIKRDGSECWLCGERIDLRRKHPHPRSMTLDHVVPMGRGGADVASNIALAHKICNESKKDKMPCDYFHLPEGLLFRTKNKSALLLICESEEELHYVVNKLSRTRNKRLKMIMNNIIKTLQK